MRTNEPSPSPEEARARLRQVAGEVDAVVQPVREHPWLTVGAAFGIGMLLGTKPGLRRAGFSLASSLLDRKHRPR